jgi:DNA-binding NtrC family response regulator
MHVDEDQKFYKVIGVKFDEKGAPDGVQIKYKCHTCLTDLTPAIEAHTATMVKDCLVTHASGVDHFESVKAFEIFLVKRALAHSNGNKTLAAKHLSLNRTTFLEKMRRMGFALLPPKRAK